MGDSRFDAETESGQVEVSVYERDTNGNAAWVAMTVTGGGDSGFVSFTLDQAEAFATTLLAAIKSARPIGEA